MLDKFVSEPAATERLQAGLLGSHVESFAELLRGDGYSRSTVRSQLCLLKHFSKWLEEKDLEVADISEDVVQKFVADRRKRRGHACVRRGEPPAVRRFLDHLRTKGVVPSAEPAADDESPQTALKSRYEDYLKRERGVAASTFTTYWLFVRRFLTERFDKGPIRLNELTAKDVARFPLRHVSSMKPKGAKLMVSALRSFFRFLFQHGEINTDLVGALPTVPAWRLTEVPRYLQAEDVDRVLDTCNLETPIGRRNHAVLLLLARLGLRGGEVLGLELDDIDWRAGELIVRGKRDVQDRLPLPEEVGRAIANYLRKDRPQSKTRRVFVRARAPHRGFSHPSSVSTIVRRALEKASLDTAFKGAHLLRHSLATGMLRRGASMVEISEILRHRSPQTTEIYAKVDVEALRSLAQPWPITGGER